ncbi:hypothetical protein K438DRAFT_1934636 [Mycena galopus ATCC 62051]|nr:hypothetical protein K438DRAFT_1934636 [Mycena galopus ATCC 62051]
MTLGLPAAQPADTVYQRATCNDGGFKQADHTEWQPTSSPHYSVVRRAAVVHRHVEAACAEPLEESDAIVVGHPIQFTTLSHSAQTRFRRLGYENENRASSLTAMGRGTLQRLRGRVRPTRGYTDGRQRPRDSCPTDESAGMRTRSEAGKRRGRRWWCGAALRESGVEINENGGGDAFRPPTGTDSGGIASCVPVLVLPAFLFLSLETLETLEKAVWIWECHRRLSSALAISLILHPSASPPADPLCASIRGLVPRERHAENGSLLVRGAWTAGGGVVSGREQQGGLSCSLWRIRAYCGEASLDASLLATVRVRARLSGVWWRPSAARGVLRCSGELGQFDIGSACIVHLASRPSPGSEARALRTRRVWVYMWA